MSKLRQAMIEAMQMRGFATRTQQSYLYAIQSLANFAERSPALLNDDDIQDYFRYLVTERKLAPSSCRLHLNAIVFLFRDVLHRELKQTIRLPSQPQRIPELLTRQEVAAIFAACRNDRHRILLQVCYACGLRVSELVHLQVQDIDGERHLLRINQGKGAKDRLVELPEATLTALRNYWRRFHPKHWLFPSLDPTNSLTSSTAGKIFKTAKTRADVRKQGGIHSLRHAYATHQLAAGMPLVKLQAQMGHRCASTTMRYLHWLPQSQGGGAPTDLLHNLENANAH